LVLNSSKCTPEKNDRKYIYDCEIDLKNDRESKLEDYRFVISSSARFSNFNFDSCKPGKANDSFFGSLVVETKGEGASDCKFKVSLGSYEKLTVRLKINGDENVPDPEIMQ
jgi:hypothetical protein